MISEVDQITPTFIRAYLSNLENNGHNVGGVLACYRALKTFLKRYAFENDLVDWNNPIDKVKVKNPNDKPLDPVDIQAVKAIIATCDNSFIGLRDKAIILMLLDTGMRINELLTLVEDNVNPITGVIRIMHAKGGKFRAVYMGRKTCLVYRKYLSKRPYKTALSIRQKSKDTAIPILFTREDGYKSAAGNQTQPAIGRSQVL